MSDSARLVELSEAAAREGRLFDHVELLGIAVRVRRMEVALDEWVADAHEDELLPKPSNVVRLRPVLAFVR